MIKTAVIGLGWWGRHVSACLNQEGGRFHVVRGIDLNLELARELAAEHGFEPSADLADALNDKAVDAVVLTTPHAQHAEQIGLAAAAGKHVFCEKPLTLTADSARAAVAACADAGVALGVGHERRWEPAIAEVKRLVGAGELGAIMHVESNSSHDKLAGLSASDWRAHPDNGPSVPMTGMGIHLTDFFIDLFGEIGAVHAERRNRVVEFETGDVASVHLKFQSGLTGYFSCVLVTPFFYRLQVFGSDGWVEVRDSSHPDDPCSIARLTTCGKSGELATREYKKLDSVAANFNAFADAIDGAAPYPITPAQMINNIATLEAIAKSFASGAPETVSGQ